MALQLTPESFLAIVQQSGLIEPEQLQRLLNEFRLRDIKLEQSRTLADELVASNALSRWQAEKLLQGKHRGFFLGKYRLLSLLGKGGMSSVYLAEHTVMRRRCAIKVLPTKRVNDSSYLGRFHREAQAVANLDHPNIVRAYDVDKEKEGNTEIHFLVMEYIDGESLQEIVARKGVFDFVTAVDHIRQTAEGLIHAHSIGMVHRDIKPGNLLVDTNGVVKILDMGLARFFDDGEKESLTVTHDEKVLGTADYLAPEQALDSHTVDARADIYSLGCTIYFLLTGHPPFTEGTLAQRLMSHQMKTPPPVSDDRSDIPADLAAIVEKMMAKDVSKRYQSATDISQVLYEWLEVNADDDWKQKHAIAGGSGPSLQDDPQSSSSSDGSQEAGTLSDPLARKLGAQISQSPSGIKPNDTASLSASETGKDASGSPLSPEPSDPASSNSIEDIPLAPIDEDEDNTADETLLPPVEKKSPSPPARRDSSPGKPSPARPQKSSGTPKQGSPSGIDASKRPQQGRKSQTPHPQRRKGLGKKESIASQASSETRQTGHPRQRQQKPAQQKSVQQAKPSQQSKVPHNAIIARPIADPREEEGKVAEVVPIESLTPLAEPVTPQTPAAVDSTIRPSGGSSIIRTQESQREKAILAGAGIVLLLLLVVVVFVVIWSSSSGTGDSGVANDSGTSIKEELHPVITVGPSGEFKTISDALEHVRANYKPISSTDTQTIRVVGGITYRENIVITNTEEDPWPQGVRLVCEGAEKAVLVPSTTGPIVALNDVSRFLLEGMEFRANGSPVALELRGDLSGTTLRDLTIGGFIKTGIHAAGAHGRDANQGRLVLDRVVFRGESRLSDGIRLDHPRFITVRGSRFYGPLQTGIIMAASGGQAEGIEIQETIVTNANVGLKIDATKMQLSNLDVWSNTFHKVRYGIAFSEVPSTPAKSSGELRFTANLFTEIQAEAFLENGETKAILAMFSANGIKSNWSSRSAPKNPAPQEIHLFEKDEHRGVKFQFISVDPAHKSFLVPRPKAEHRAIGALGM